MAEERTWGQGTSKNLFYYNVWGKKNGRKTGERAESSRVAKKIKYVILFKT